jgi:dihydrofolate reductase
LNYAQAIYEDVDLGRRFCQRFQWENDWIFKSSDETSRAWVVGQTWKAGLIIMGRKSFEVMAPYWPTAPGHFAAPMNEIPKALFTKKGFKDIDPLQTTRAELSPATASWAEARIFDGDLAEEIRKLKSEPGKPICAMGVPDLCGA